MFRLVFGLACVAAITDVGDSRWASRNLNSWHGPYPTPRPTPRPVATWYSSDDASSSDSSGSKSASQSGSKSVSGSKSGSGNSASKSGSRSKSSSGSKSDSKSGSGSGSSGSTSGKWSSSNTAGSSSKSGSKTSSGSGSKQTSSSNSGAWSGRGYYVPSPTQSPTEEDPLVKPSCHSDCIEVSGFDIDKYSQVGEYLESTFSSNMGGASAFTGTYCWKDECDCYEKDYDANNMYDVSIELEHNEIMFDYMNAMGGMYQAKYSKHYYGDLGCIEDFFNSNRGKRGNWKLESSMFSELDGEYIDVDPTFSSQYCYCVM